MGTLGKINENQKDLILDIYGGKSFVKIYQAFSIGKVKFSFATKENPQDGIDIYVDIDILNCDFIDLIRSGELYKLAALEKQRAKEANEQYCNAIWESPIGAVDEKTMRKFELQPGTRTAFAFRATEGQKSIIVGCDYRSLKLLAERWRFLLPDYEVYMRNRFNINAMENNYHESQHRAYVKEEKNILNEKQESASSDTGYVGIPRQEEPQKTDKEAEKPEDVTLWRMKVSKAITDMTSGCKALKAVTEDNRELPLVLDKKIIALPTFDDFEKRVKRVGSIIQIKGYLATDRIMVTELL